MSRLPLLPLFLPLFWSFSDSYEIELAWLAINKYLRQFGKIVDTVNWIHSRLIKSTSFQAVNYFSNSHQRFVPTFQLYFEEDYISCVVRWSGLLLIFSKDSETSLTKQLRFRPIGGFVTVSLKGGNGEATRKGFRKGLRKSRFPPPPDTLFEAGKSKYKRERGDRFSGKWWSNRSRVASIDVGKPWRPSLLSMTFSNRVYRSLWVDILILTRLKFIIEEEILSVFWMKQWNRDSMKSDINPISLLSKGEEIVL